MKIAIPLAQGQLCLHFGHCEQFAIIEADTENKTIISKEMLTPPPHEPGLLPAWLHEAGVNLVITGGMGMRAQNLFRQSGIGVIAGATPADPEEIVKQHLDGILETGSNICDH